ncbi:unnamed protein product [Ectocarpus sp. 6 AP-2014]
MNRLVRFGAEALKPQRVAGAHKWQTPRVSRRKANVLRKKAIRDGSFGSVVMDADTGKAIGGWDPAWDIFEAPAPRPLRPPKLHKNQRDRAQRAEKITAKLGEQEARLKDLNRVKAVPKPKPEDGALALLRWLKTSGAAKKR